MDYLELLDRLHSALDPNAYLEIGVDLGLSLAVSRARSIAIDPDPRPSAEAMLGKPWVKLFRTTSDAFFREHTHESTLEGHTLDLAFIDGLHEFAQVVRDFENVERWGHPGTVVVIHDVLPVDAWQAMRSQHGGSWTGDVWRIVPFLERFRPDLRCFLVDVWETGVLVVTGLDPGRAGMAALAEELDRGYPLDGPDYERLVQQWLQSAEPLPPGPVLQALPSQPRAVGYAIEGDGWTANPKGWIGTRDATSRQLRIVLDEPIRGSHRARLTVTASGMSMLVFRAIYADETVSPASLRHRNVVLDVTHPGALMHGLDSVRLAADPEQRVFELDWESAVEPGEALTSVVIEPLDDAMWPTASTPAMTVNIQNLELERIAWPRSGTRFAPERFPGRSAPPKRKDGKRDAVVFAWWLPATPEAHKVGEYYLGLLRYHHADSKIFVGINHGSDPEWSRRLEQAGLDLEVVAVDPSIQVSSDAGGYLAALGAFSRNHEEFDLVWFGHTKGASQPRFDDYTGSRHQHDRKSWSRRAEIDRFFADPKIGLFAHRYALHDPSPDAPWNGFGDLDSLERVYRDTYAPLGLWVWETVFVMRHEVVRRFCAAVGEEFFRLDPTSYGAGRWWFEAAFPSIASMQGFEPLIEVDIEGAGNPRGDILLYDDPRQTNRLAMEELQRWRQNPFTFAPLALPRGYTRDPIVPHDAEHDALARGRYGMIETP